MPTTRKKTIKTVYKDEDESDHEKSGDFSDSGSEAVISGGSSSSEADVPSEASSVEDFTEKPQKKSGKAKTKCSTTAPKQQRLFTFTNKEKFAKAFISRIKDIKDDDDEDSSKPSTFSVKDLTEADKQLPSFLNLSDSDSSEDEVPKSSKSKKETKISLSQKSVESVENEKYEYKDVFSNNTQDESEEVAKKTFLELQKHKNLIDETKARVEKYSANLKAEVSTVNNSMELDVSDLLAQGEEVSPEPKTTKKSIKNRKKKKDDSDSEMEDWEEVNEAGSSVPKQGLQLVVDFADAVIKKKKEIDVEMMMRRKINRVKKEYQVYMHKVHVLCWLGHGNYVSKVLNDQEVLAAALTLVPSKECYPGERVDMKYLEQITTWFKDKLTLKQDKHEDKFRPKAPQLKEILMSQIKSRTATTKKYIVFIFVSMLRALGLTCRVMFNFVTVPIRPPESELCSLSVKDKKNSSKADNKKDSSKTDDKKDTSKTDEKKETSKTKKGQTSKKGTSKSNQTKSKSIPQLDGVYDSFASSDDEFESIMQLDGNNDGQLKARSTRSGKANANTKIVEKENEVKDVSPPKKAKLDIKGKAGAKNEVKVVESAKRKRAANKATSVPEKTVEKIPSKETSEKPTKSPSPSPRKTRSRTGTPFDDSKVAGKAEDTKPNKTLKSDDKMSKTHSKSRTSLSLTKVKEEITPKQEIKTDSEQSKIEKSIISPRKTRSLTQPKPTDKKNPPKLKKELIPTTKTEVQNPEIIITKPESNVSSEFFEGNTSSTSKRFSLSRKRSHTSTIPSNKSEKPSKSTSDDSKTKSRTRSAPGKTFETSKYFETKTEVKKPSRQRRAKEDIVEDAQRVSHKDLARKAKSKNDVTRDLVDIIKKRVKESKEDTKKRMVKGKQITDLDEDSDHLPEEEPKSRNSDSDEDFKPKLNSSRQSTSSKKDRRVLSTDTEEHPKNKTDVWCEVFVEELEQWICVDVIKAVVHCASAIYARATHPVSYIVGWDNNNNLKDLTRRYVPHWNTVTRKQRVAPEWWGQALGPYLGARNARDREEDDCLDRMQMEAPLPKSIGEYKNHPLYALKRHLLKFEALYPPDAPTLGFVRGEPVYARECVYVLRSREKWLNEAKVVKLGEKPYKIVTARPKWDRLSNRMIDGGKLEIYGPWQLKDYEPPVAENGIVPRNEYGNVELFKECMLPKGTALIKLPNLARVAKMLQIDCAPAMTGFDYSGGYAHPRYDGFVVCQEFKDIITDAWHKDQEEQEKRQIEKMELRVYGNWKRLIKGLLIRERLKDKYGFEQPTASKPTKTSKGPSFVAKKGM